MCGRIFCLENGSSRFIENKICRAKIATFWDAASIFLKSTRSFWGSSNGANLLGKKLWSELRAHRVWRRGPFNNGQHLQFLTNTLSALIARHWPSFLRGWTVYLVPTMNQLRHRPLATYDLDHFLTHSYHHFSDKYPFLLLLLWFRPSMSNFAT